MPSKLHCPCYLSLTLLYRSLFRNRIFSALGHSPRVINSAALNLDGWVVLVASHVNMQHLQRIVWPSSLHATLCNVFLDCHAIHCTMNHLQRIPLLDKHVAFLCKHRTKLQYSYVKLATIVATEMRKKMLLFPLHFDFSKWIFLNEIRFIPLTSILNAFRSVSGSMYLTATKLFRHFAL